MSENELAVLEARLCGMEAKLDRIEGRIESFAEANARHSVQIHHLEDSVKLCHQRVSEVKKEAVSTAKGMVKWFVGALAAALTAAVAAVWNLMKSEIGK
jgi:predicted phage tail protein